MLKFTEYHTGKPVYVNAKNVCIVDTTDEYTRIFTSGDSIRVCESIDRVITKLDIYLKPEVTK